ncbi:tyrosine-protein kinase [Streptococcus danieliae]|uniref:tyrosine-protein kinase n=1 Tax=Streptococcus danieliae TaxID=747656 RepID=UPI0021C62908|nr:tyrosine-protein kinase [Streptococcus danieliae]MCU0082370.1 tyrosine-protein kinase [Streptococcus danieliae]
MPTLKLNRARREDAEKTEEFYNALRTNIQLSGDGIDVISISSVQSGEGKSTTSVNLAIAFARSGYQTLLVDADIRNSVMSGVFSTRDKITGLTDYLTGKNDLSEGLCDTDIENLYVIQAGPVSPNPTGLLQSQNFNKMIDILRKYYDYIIIDTPPIGLVIDAAIITQQGDATVLVVESGSNKRRAVEKAVEQLEQTGTPFLGVILNKVDTSMERYGSYGAYGSYGDYGNYGKKIREEKKKKEKKKDKEERSRSRRNRDKK